MEENHHPLALASFHTKKIKINRNDHRLNVDDVAVDAGISGKTSGGKITENKIRR